MGPSNKYIRIPAALAAAAAEPHPTAAEVAENKTEAAPACSPKIRIEGSSSRHV